MMSGVSQIRDAGVIGCGGAGFPTHVKLSANPQHLIVNAMECEPVLCTDRYVMRHFPEQLVAALAAIGREIGAEDCTFSLKETYTAEIAALREAIRRSGEQVEIHTVGSFYPAGDEQVVVYETTGQVVPPLNIPISAGSVVLNVSTLLACYNAMAGVPFTHRFLTVAGAVRTPCIVYAPIGTSFCDCIALAGGITEAAEDVIILSGGPMMGKRIPDDDPKCAYVEKTTSGILVLPKRKYRKEPLALERIRRTARTSCIQCTNCTEMCPRHLLGHDLAPHKIMRMLAYHPLEEILNEPVIQAAQLCSECGICELYACPMGLRPRSVNALVKQELARAGIRLPKAEKPTVPHPMREDRKIPSHRMAARAGVADYYDTDTDLLKIAEPNRLVIPVRQGIGKAPDILVNPGDRVSAGQRIAECPSDRMGAHLAAPFAGVVTETGNRIVIER